ncbi:FAD binding domain-containing protein [Nocardia asteroides]|uniref:Oxidoreductase FAD-binding subunit n=1 Tax=Nocardia asteroides NBRC 15531 TaxID=1110697 RepID=U5E7L8_NOCAS|nr:xanthine dehydrogenase family protein subunit M [Nocardia asteroides]UGT51257.1 xanthine dehydrogenase family protein subunit M [Nocardia asteroides]GAD85977.1 putative oxidoreductase FAD-binding subunit [Nocardia asteroides NBRC 15531]SFM31063.1 xanthine dehydrogenase YagS FAD-binding subunit [Nocardia asteroides]VEG35858.1 4-hydroxybenzoyl-CoA reductase subunit beta [Nocardia asteroides]
MREFDYERATDAARAVAAVRADPDAAFLGAGTNLVDHLKLGITAPSRLVDVSRLPFDEVTELADGGVRVGSAVRNADLAAHPLIRRRYRMLSAALLAGASPQLRNLATTAGNLLQRTRCPYFQDPTTPCNKRAPGSGCSAIGGFDRDHAILGASDQCVATHPSDMAVALTALDAVVRILGAEGERTIPVVDLHRLPGEDPDRDTVLDHGDLITAVDIPALGWAAGSTYRKVRDRASFAFALVSVAAAVDLADGVVRDARVAFGGVAHKPWRAYAAEDALRGQPATESAFADAADAELAAARPLRENGFKIPLARRVLVSTLRELTGA